MSAGIQPTRTQRAAIYKHQGLSGTKVVVTGGVKIAIQARVTSTSLAATAALMNISRSRLNRYLTGTPHKGDVMAIEMMWLSVVELGR